MSVVSVKKSDIPVYLQASGFYKSLDLDVDEEITVPADCFKVDDTVNNVDDLRRLLSTLRFWGDSTLPYAAVDFVLSANAQEETLNALAKFETDLHLQQLRELYNCPVAGRVELAVKQDSMLMLKYFELRGAEVNEKSFLTACEHNSLHCLMYICSKRVQVATDLLASIVSYMICKGYLRCIEYLHSQGYDVISADAAGFACVYGHLDVLMFYLSLHSPVIETNSICNKAACNGHVECFKYACEQGLLPAGNGELIIDESRYAGIVKYLHEERGEPFHPEACTRAVARGNLELLQYLHEQGCEVTVEVSNKAALQGFLPCLQYLHEHGCPWDQTVFASAAQRGKLDCLKYLLDNGCEGDAAAAMAMAVKCGKVPVLRFLHEYGFAMHSTLCALAMRVNQLPCLTYLHEHGAEWGDTNTDEATKSGFYGCVVYAHEHGCPWGPNTCSNAALYGKLNCLQYAYEHGAPWDIAVYKDSSVHRNPACSAYIGEQLAKLVGRSSDA